MPERQNRRSACHGFDHDEPEGFRPVDGEQKARASPKELRLLAFVDFPHELTPPPVIEKRLDLGLEIRLVRFVDLCGDLQRYAAARAILMARSGRFSAEIRPRNAR